MNESPLEGLRKQLRDEDPFIGIDRQFRTVLGGHGQTLLGHFLPSGSDRSRKQERVSFSTPDGDRLVGFMMRPNASDDVGLLHIFHGLSGSSESLYMPRAAQMAVDLGFSVVRWNHRGCGEGRNLALEPCHSGRSDDLARAVKWGRDWHSQNHSTTTNCGKKYVHGVLGYSLSGNATCLLAAAVIPALDTLPMSDTSIEKLAGSLPDFAIAVNPPFNLKRASEKLSSGSARAYGLSFMGELLSGLEDRAAWQPEDQKRKAFRDLAARARKNLGIFSDIATLDAAYTGVAGGFRDHLDYYDRASSGRYLQHVRVPLVILSAADDPITDGTSGLPNEFLAATPGVKSNVVVDFQSEGGHMGYVDRATLLSSWKQETRWLERRIQLYLRAFISKGSDQ